jgi:cytoskeletal protein RodZ
MPWCVLPIAQYSSRFAFVTFFATISRVNSTFLLGLLLWLTRFYFGGYDSMSATTVPAKASSAAKRRDRKRKTTTAPTSETNNNAASVPGTAAAAVAATATTNSKTATSTYGGVPLVPLTDLQMQQFIAVSLFADSHLKQRIDIVVVGVVMVIGWLYNGHPNFTSIISC